MRSDTVMTGLLLLMVMAVKGAHAAKSCSEQYKNSVKGFNTRLQYAVDDNNYSCVKEFLDAGDDPNRWNRFGARAVSDAAISGNADIMKLLLEYGANADGAYAGEPPINLAACRGHEAVVKVLVEAGVSKARRGRDGKTAAETACTCVEGGSCPKDAILSLLASKNPGVSFNTDYPSSDGILNNGANDLTSSNMECWELCSKTQGCKAWTRIKQTQPNGSKAGECWLRNYEPEPKNCDYCDSGVTECAVLYNTDYPSQGGVLNSGKNELTANNAECCALCRANPKCKAWTRIKSSTEYNQEGECWLRDYIPDRKYSGVSDSGSMS